MIEIIKWSDSFESADTRKRQRLGWFLSPSGCDSKGFRKLMRMGKDGLISLGFFQALCQSMATQSIDNRKRGVFLNSDKTLMDLADILELARLDGMEPADYRQAIGRLVSVGWISLHNSLDSQQSAGSLPPICRSSPSFVQGEGEGQGEEEGKEKGKVGKKLKATLPEVISFISEVGLKTADAEYIFHSWESNGWTRNGKPVKDWKSQIRAWKSAGYFPSQKLAKKDQPLTVSQMGLSGINSASSMNV